jgi:hypothetical protein
MARDLPESDMPPLTREMHGELKGLRRALGNELADCCRAYELINPSHAYELVRTFATEFYDCYFEFYSQYPRCKAKWRRASEGKAFTEVLEVASEFEGIANYFADNQSLFNHLTRTISEHAASGEQTLPVMSLGGQPRKPPSVFTPINTPNRKRWSAMIDSPSAVRKVEAFVRKKGLGWTEFASRVQTTDRTLRNFRKTNQLSRSILTTIAEEMGTTLEDLMSE